MHSSKHSVFIVYLTSQVIKNKFLFTMMAYPGQTLTLTTLGQLCAALWDSQSWPGIVPGSVVMPLDRCAIQEPQYQVA